MPQAMRTKDATARTVGKKRARRLGGGARGQPYSRAPVATRGSTNAGAGVEMDGTAAGRSSRTATRNGIHEDNELVESRPCGRRSKASSLDKGTCACLWIGSGNAHVTKQGVGCPRVE